MFDAFLLVFIAGVSNTRIIRIPLKHPTTINMAALEGM
jgi:hypothetical protein